MLDDLDQRVDEAERVAAGMFHGRDVSGADLAQIAAGDGMGNDGHDATRTWLPGTVGFIDPRERLQRRGFGDGRHEGRMAKRSMGELERAVTDILWDRGGWLTPGEVHAALDDPALAYTTVMTILVRLWRKGRLERQRDGRAYAYHPVVTRAQYAAQRMEEVLAGAKDRAAVLNHFLDGMEPADRAQLRRLLNTYRSP